MTARRSRSWQARAFSWAKNRPSTSSREWSSTIRNSRARTEPSRLGQGTQGPISTSLIHRSFGRAASYLPYVFGSAASASRCSPARRSWARMVRSATVIPCRWNKIEAIWAAERPGSSRRSAAASANSSGCARTVPASARGEGRNASSPPARQARSQRSIVPREYRRADPSGWVWARAAIWRTTAPRSAAVSRSLAASAITAQRCNAISSCPVRSMRFSVHAGYGGTGGMKRRLPTIR